MVGRLFAQSPELYSDIMLAQFERVEPLLEAYKNTYEHTLSMLRDKDKEALMSAFSDAKVFFSDASDQFLSQSRALLNKANDAKVLG